MKKINIIKKNYDIEAVLKSKKVIRTKHFRLYIQNDNNLLTSQWAILVGKKNGNAVKRNKIRRQIKSILYHEIKNVPSNKYALIYIAPKDKIIPFEEKKEQLNKILKGIK